MNRTLKLGIGGTLAALTFVFVTAASCDPAKPTSAADQANQNAKDRTNYVPVNDVEGRNYNARLKIADSPATLIWCSVYPTNPNVKPFTVPIAGKLTSGNKRPFPSQNPKSGDGNSVWYEEQADAQGMYGTSGDYRYGFDPAGNYHDFYGLEVYCTTVPTVIQKNTTEIAIGVSGDLNAIDKQVEAALAACRKANTDPSAPCPAAMAILGVK